MTLRAAEDHYRSQAQLAAVVAARVAALWRRGGFDVNSWRSRVPTAARTVAAGQYAAAAAADDYVATALLEQDVVVPADARVRPAAFAGMSNGPLPVPDLLDLPRIRALQAVGAGVPVERAVERAGNQLQTYAASLVQDAGRQADGVATFTRRSVGWVRMVNPPCCADCAILAGRWYRSNEGFLRHPRCDCKHAPALEDAAGDVGTDPKALFASGKVTGLREAEAQAIADGADPAQVVNARRGRSADKMTTTAGKARGLRRGVQRPTPDAIYRFSANRDEALAVLADAGYIN